MLKLQIVNGQDVVVRFPGGGDLEREFIETCVKAILAKGVGIARTEAHVAEDIRAGLTETIFALKADTRYLPPKDRQ